MHQCPKCKSDKVNRSRTRSTWEAWRKEVTGKRPYRCHQCGWRAWSHQTGPRPEDVQREIVARAFAPDAPNLVGTAFSRDFEPAREVDLDQLDTIDPKRA